MILVPLLNPKFATSLPLAVSELLVRGTKSGTAKARRASLISRDQKLIAIPDCERRNLGRRH